MKDKVPGAEEVTQQRVEERIREVSMEACAEMLSSGPWQISEMAGFEVEMPSNVRVVPYRGDRK